jgi:transposase
MARRHELSDEQWNAIKGLVPGKKGDPGRTGCNNRLFINAVLFVLKTGIPWWSIWKTQLGLETVRSLVCFWRLGADFPGHR